MILGRQLVERYYSEIEEVEEQREYATPAQIERAAKQLGVNPATRSGKKAAMEFISKRNKTAIEVRNAKKQAYKGTKVKITASGSANIVTPNNIGTVGGTPVKGKSIELYHSPHNSISSTPGKGVSLLPHETGFNRLSNVTAADISNVRNELARESSYDSILRASKKAKVDTNNYFANRR